MSNKLIGMVLSLCVAACSGRPDTSDGSATESAGDGTSTGSGTATGQPTGTTGPGCDTECECQTADDCDQSFASHMCIDGRCECLVGCCSPAECTATSGESSTGSTASTDATSATTGGSDGSSGTGAGSGMILDPETLEVFDLPIGSVRYAVAGQDLASDTCVTFIWFGELWEQTCAQPGMQDWPYVVVTPQATAPCMQWAYGPNVTIDGATGCVQLTNGIPLTATIELQVEVTGAPYTGTISVIAP